MALPRLPPIRDLLDNPASVLSLPLPLLSELLDRLKHIDRSLSGVSGLPEDPVSLAIRYPRFAWMDAPHLHHLSQEIAFTVEDKGALIVSMPPQHGKSFTCAAWTTFWYLAKNPTHCVLYISYEKTVARRWGAKVRDLVLSHGDEFGLRLDPRKTASDDWELTSGGGMVCVGVGGPISGRTVHLLLVDDAIKDDEAARSDVQRQALWDWWEQTASQRIQPDTTTIVVGTRWHASDLIGRLIEASDSGEGKQFRQVTLRAKAEKDDPLGRALGEGLWKAKSQTFYDDKERHLSTYSWNGIFQQRPSPPGGNMVDPAWWRFYRPSERPASFDQGAQTWDLALDSVRKSDSFMAGMVLGRVGAIIYVRDGFHDHCDINKVIETVQAWHRLYPWAKQKLVERAVAGNALVQVLQRKISGMLAWPPKGRRKGSKEACLNACIPDIRSGNILLPCNEDGTRPRWVEEFVTEMQQFPRAPNDDWVDAFSQGAGFLLPSVGQAIEAARTDALRPKPAESLQEAHTAAIHDQLKKKVVERMRLVAKQGAAGSRGNVVAMDSALRMRRAAGRGFGGMC